MTTRQEIRRLRRERQRDVRVVQAATGRRVSDDVTNAQISGLRRAADKLRSQRRKAKVSP